MGENRPGAEKCQGEKAPPTVCERKRRTADLSGHPHMRARLQAALIVRPCPGISFLVAA